MDLRNFKIKRTKTVLLLVLSSLLFSCIKEKPTEKPNIIIILTDDQGFGDISSHGNSLIETPQIDRIAREGTRLSQFYVSPVCAPTRASLLTGRYSLRTGTQWVTFGLENMNSEEITFAEVFKEQGYETGLFGKWHNGTHYPMDPKGQGFDTFFGFKQGHYNNYFDTQLEYNGVSIQTSGFITDVLTDSAIAFIKKNADKPFLAFIPYNAPHSPFQVPDKYFNHFKNKGLSDKNAAVYGMVENLDDNIGRILDQLKSLQLEENTIVIFMTDNGPNGHDRFNAHMKGYKAKVDEGGVRVPFFIRWPGKIPKNKLSKELTAHIDLLPTLIDLTGIKPKNLSKFDGISFADVLKGKKTNLDGRKFYTHHSKGAALEMFPGAVRDGRYLAVKQNGDWELFDVQADPFQEYNVSTYYPEMLHSLASDYESWFNEVSNNLKGRKPIPVGFEEAPIVDLPAVESYFSNGIKFFGESGWSNDWLSNWKSEQDSIWWNLDVVQAIKVDVVVHYTLQSANKDVPLLAFSKSNTSIKASISPFKPSRIPSSDRIQRSEVYDQTWNSQLLGELDLEKGLQKICLKRSESSSNSTVEIKSLELIFKEE